ncbi:hypothetical protein [Flavobacterium gawalongense]|uniref:Uncharacterized protein n=1 Tax=Flavobacterium gawalongense TaxID=2594432 RepID=A0A553BD95_9FLAO|nr:hypothetical protein [Flavobacterium gawalongense]TRX06202.1 hypothetical protein FNW11_14985 [Flavobacterium gawalongense]TRX06934.1 hypothetical protein FNW10_15345 [Flavobacterium gawalongense]TRX22564.1 hypothetical protein FNW38_15595 [Flavobacterium gawalongense]
MKKTTLEKLEKSKKKKSLERKNKILLGLLIGLFSVFVIFIIVSFVDNNDNIVSDSGVYPYVDSTSTISDKERINLEITRKNMEYRNNWQNYINVNTNQYSYHEIGGVKNLQILATNNTSYLINQMTVNVCYVIDNGDCYLNEEVVIYNIAPNSTKSELAPSSNRGKKIRLDIIDVYSDKMNFHYKTATSVNSSPDPYFTKM